MVKMAMEIGFGRLGHFDSFGDAAGAHLMQACAAADPEFLWFSVWGHRFPLPTDLGTMMLVGMVIILLFQTLPALVLLISKKYMPVALKFNEFTLLLAAIECQFDTKLGADVWQPMGSHGNSSLVQRACACSSRVPFQEVGRVSTPHRSLKHPWATWE